MTLPKEVSERFDEQKAKWEEKGYDLLWEDLKTFLAQEIERAREEENQSWLKRERCSICGNKMKPKVTTDTCDKCFDEE